MQTHNQTREWKKHGILIKSEWLRWEKEANEKNRHTNWRWKEKWNVEMTMTIESKSNRNRIADESANEKTQNRLESNRSVKWMSAAILPPVEWIINWFQALDERTLNGITFSVWFRILVAFLLSFFLSVYRHPVVARSLSIRPFRLVGVLFSSNPVLSIITVQFSLFELASVFICSVCLLSMCNVHVQNSQCIIPNV